MIKELRTLFAVTFVLLAGACGQKTETASTSKPPESSSEAAGTSTTTSAASPTASKPAQVAANANETPPMENGVYVVQGICFGEGGCPFKHWRASQEVQLRERLDPASPVIATVKPGQWVEPVEGQMRLIPTRGVVRKARDVGQPPLHLAEGDVVYMLEGEGEGYYSFWWHGRALGSEWAEGDESDPISWDPNAAAPAGVITGWWVRLKLENGKSGWVEDPRFECMGPLGGDAGCRD